MFCSKCGNEVASDSKFCGECSNLNEGFVEVKEETSTKMGGIKISKVQILTIIGIVVLGVVAIGGFKLSGLSSNSSKDAEVVFYSKGSDNYMLYNGKEIELDDKLDMYEVSQEKALHMEEYMSDYENGYDVVNQSMKTSLSRNAFYYISDRKLKRIDFKSGKTKKIAKHIKSFSEKDEEIYALNTDNELLHIKKGKEENVLDEVVNFTVSDDFKTIVVLTEDRELISYNNKFEDGEEIEDDISFLMPIMGNNLIYGYGSGGSISKLWVHNLPTDEKTEFDTYYDYNTGGNIYETSGDEYIIESIIFDTVNDRLILTADYSEYSETCIIKNGEIEKSFSASLSLWDSKDVFELTLEEDDEYYLLDEKYNKTLLQEKNYDDRVDTYSDYSNINNKVIYVTEDDVVVKKRNEEKTSIEIDRDEDLTRVIYLEKEDRVYAVVDEDFGYYDDDDFEEIKMENDYFRYFMLTDSGNLLVFGDEGIEFVSKKKSELVYDEEIDHSFNFYNDGFYDRENDIRYFWYEETICAISGDKGKLTTIADDYDEVKLVNGVLFYILDEVLYKVEGSKSTVISDDVDSFFNVVIL